LISQSSSLAHVAYLIEAYEIYDKLEAKMQLEDKKLE